jgi:hypothetical protein
MKIKVTLENLACEDGRPLCFTEQNVRNSRTTYACLGPETVIHIALLKINKFCNVLYILDTTFCPSDLLWEEENTSRIPPHFENRICSPGVLNKVCQLPLCGLQCDRVAVTDYGPGQL